MQPNDIINGRYKLIEPIGSGSFGQVWLAEDLELGIRLAVKIYIALDPKGLDEFKTEFKNTRNLNHPYLLRADHYDVAGNNPYLVMSYCPDSLGNRLGRLDEQEMWKFISQVAEGLSYLHEMDIVHRDVKPDNILINEHGDYVVSDFGLSKKMRSTLRRASARNENAMNDSSGTIGYMAPEMFSAHPEAVKATDVWALGATIYEVATGDLPFLGQGGVMELGGAAVPDLPQAFSPALNDLLHRCLARDMEARPTASDICNIAAPHVKHASQGGPAVPPLPPTPGSKKGNVKHKKENAAAEGTILDDNTGGIPPMPPVTDKKASQNFDLNGPGTIYGDNNTPAPETDHAPETAETAQPEPQTVIVKKGGVISILFWVLIPLLVIVCVTLAILWSSEASDADYYRQRAAAFSSTLSDIQSAVEGPAPDAMSYASWTSSNHEANSTGTNSYNIDVSADDIITLDYDVDSESFDHLRIYASIDGGEDTLLRDISGRGRTGSLSYTAPSSGRLVLRCDYSKDFSVNDGRDNARVYNVLHHPSAIGAVRTALNDCEYYFW